MSADYTTGSTLSDRDLEIASFWVKHRLTLRRLGYGSIIAIGSMFWAFTLWSLLDAYAISYPIESRIHLRILQNQNALAPLFLKGPTPLKPADSITFTNTDGRQDVLVEIENANTVWWAEFDYAFAIGDQRTDTRHGFILPKSRRFITEPGITLSGQSPELIIENLQWKRVTPDTVPTTIEDFVASREPLIEDVAFARDQVVGTQLIGRTTFTVNNTSAYGYYDPEFVIVLLRGGSPVAVTRITKDKLNAGEIMPFDIQWFDQPVGITETIVQTNINYLNPNSYIRPINQ
ncbi:MAG: hypothetical protein KC582_03695 [Candidatus Magasanikbacteria bacterium]|nr:hypothetical protein [Candidatus Magasanikbacteria bacterium]USN52716.1 MAG: hypothetical protein H6759_01420 [Candidatus Nomurabacteria bacterium]